MFGAVGKQTAQATHCLFGTPAKPLNGSGGGLGSDVRRSSVNQSPVSLFRCDLFALRFLEAGERASLTVSCACLWKRGVQLEEKEAACGSWRRRRLALLAFIPLAATVALSIHITCEYRPHPGNLTLQSTVAVTCTTFAAPPPSSVFFLGGSVEFPNLSFSSPLADSASPQFRLQAQALNHYVSGLAPPPSPIFPPRLRNRCFLPSSSAPSSHLTPAVHSFLLFFFVILLLCSFPQRLCLLV